MDNEKYRFGKQVHLRLFLIFITLVFAVWYAVSTPLQGIERIRRMNIESGFRTLTAQEKSVIDNRGTERPFTGALLDNEVSGTYLCRKCGEPLYKSSSKFHSGCGWPAFDDEIKDAVIRKTDPDGSRTEILCAGCGGHLGHVFKGEGLTPKNIRHCVNSVSMTFLPDSSDGMARAYFAGGCFWGVEHLMKSMNGVKEVISGYMGGHTDNPTYEQICTGQTGHAETVEIVYDPTKVKFNQLAMLFLEIHDPSQIDGQGPDLGNQYRSAIFWVDGNQRKDAARLLDILREKGMKIATELTPAADFWPAEDYHQNYYERTGKAPYCHRRIKRF